MALSSDVWGDAGPIPPEAGEPEGLDKIEEAFRMAREVADDAGLSIGEAVSLAAERPEAWRMTRDDEAEWALRKLAEADAELEELEDRARAYVEKIQRWHDRSAEEAKQTQAFMRAHLERYGEDQREQGRKSVPLPSGQIQTRSQAPAVEIADPDALLAWANENAPEIIRVREDVLVTDLRERSEIQALPVSSGEPDQLEYEPCAVVRETIPETGEIRFVPIPGTKIRPESISVTVKADR